MKMYEWDQKYGLSKAIEMRKEKMFGNESSHLCESDCQRIENYIGSVPVPVGIAGPFEFKSNEIYIPIATTESCLVGSVNRGAKILKSSNVYVNISDSGITRAPGFSFKSEHDARIFEEFIVKNNDDIKKLVLSSSARLSLLGIKTYRNDRYVFVRFNCDADKAMGMNMVTIAVNKAVKEFILMKSPVEIVNWVISSNMCSDKKVSKVNLLDGRGLRVACYVDVEREIVERFNVSISDLMEAAELKYYKGSELAGTVSNNGQVANIVAGMFIALGQDAGHIPESSIADFSVKARANGVRFKLDIYNLIVGIVGGGAMSSYAEDFFKAMKIKNRKDLGEMICKACLAGEISLLISLARHDLAEVHDKFRNRKL